MQQPRCIVVAIAIVLYFKWFGKIESLFKNINKVSYDWRKTALQENEHGSGLSGGRGRIFFFFGEVADKTKQVLTG